MAITFAVGADNCVAGYALGHLVSIAGVLAVRTRDDNPFAVLAPLLVRDAKSVLAHFAPLLAARHEGIMKNTCKSPDGRSGRLVTTFI
jgi:hypothetical protein